MKKLKTYCKSCKRDTNHEIFGEHKPGPLRYEYDEDILEYNEYYIVKCLGCDHTGFLNRYWEENEVEGEEMEPLEDNYPSDPMSFYDFLKEEDQDELPRLIYDMYEELKMALIQELDIMAGIGLRMTVEATCLQQKIPGRNLKEKIAKLLEKGLISGQDYEVIDKLREIGNITTHKIKSPSASDLDASLEAINHLLRSVYIVQKRTKRLRSNKTG